MSTDTAEQVRQRGIAAVVVALVLPVPYLFLARPQELGPPEPPWQVLVLPLVLAGPGLIGLIAALNGRRTGLVAAAILCLAQSLVSFGGGTLPFLLPALLLLRAASAPRHPPEAGTTRPAWHPLRVLLAITISVPLVLLAIRLAGLVGILGIVLLAGAAEAWTARPRLSWPRLVDAGLGVLVVVLGIGAWASVLSTTETVCWTARETPRGLAYELVPETQTLVLEPGGVVASGCDGGMWTAGGAALAGAMLMVAGALVAIPPKDRRNAHTPFRG